MSKTYQDKLLDRRWQVKKNKILLRDGFKCQNKRCTHPENTPIHVHHLQYFNHNPWDIPDDLLITLCEYYHADEDRRNDLERHLSNTLRMKGFLMSDLLAMSCKIDTDIDFAKQLLATLREFQNG